MIFGDEKIEGLIAHRRLRDASAALAGAHAERRARAAVAAVAGDDRALARLIDSSLLACSNAEEVAAFFAAAEHEPAAYDHLIAAAALTWSGDAEGAYLVYRAAHDRAIAARTYHVAVAARERLAHHALLFGNVDVAREAIEDAIDLANAHSLAAWHVRCLASAARFALDAGDLDDAARRLVRGNAEARSPEERTLFAPTGAQLAVERGDDSAARSWSSPEILGVALKLFETFEAASAAAVAMLIGGGAPQTGSPEATALRRSLLQAESAADCVELFATAARYGDLEEARFAAEALAAVFSPRRAYLHAHQLLARAHLLVRGGDRAGSIDAAGDAARAFSAIGARRWTNEAMRLLVAQEPAGERRGRGRPSGSALTEREEQVAHLIRRGARNREVAIALQISEHTVERHVSSILGRLGLRSRWQIADPPKPAED